MKKNTSIVSPSLCAGSFKRRALEYLTEVETKNCQTFFLKKKTKNKKALDCPHLQTNICSAGEERRGTAVATVCLTYSGHDDFLFFFKRELLIRVNLSGPSKRTAAVWMKCSWIGPPVCGEHFGRLDPFSPTTLLLSCL